MRWDYVLFDLDGTLNDSMPGIAKGLVATLAHLGQPAPRWQDLRWCIGPPLKRIIASLVPGASEEQLTQAVKFYREFYAAGPIYDAVLFPGAQSLLAELRQGGHPVFLATSKPWKQARLVLERYQILDLFSGVYGPELDDTRSSKPELIAYLIEKEGLRDKQGIMIGDREYDIFGARHNGLFALGVTYGYGSPEELQAAGADKLCASLAEVRDFLFRVDA